MLTPISLANQVGQGGFTKAGRAVEQHVVQRFAASLGRLDQNTQVLFDPFLPTISSFNRCGRNDSSERMSSWFFFAETVLRSVMASPWLARLCGFFSVIIPEKVAEGYHSLWFNRIRKTCPRLSRSGRTKSGRCSASVSTL